MVSFFIAVILYNICGRLHARRSFIFLCLNVLKEEVETLNKKLSDLTEEELEQVTGGVTLGGEGGKQDNNSAFILARWGFLDHPHIKSAYSTAFIALPVGNNTG